MVANTENKNVLVVEVMTRSMIVGLHKLSGALLLLLFLPTSMPHVLPQLTGRACISAIQRTACSTLQMGPQELPAALATAVQDSGIELNSLQRDTLSVALRGLDVIIHAETGSGKTLCYALPLLSALSKRESSTQAVVLAVVPPI